MERVGKCVLGLGLLLALSCGDKRAGEETRTQPVQDAREVVDQTVQAAKEKAQELKERMPEAREQVRDALQNAKEQAHELKEQLPPAEEVKQELKEAGQKAADGLKAAGATIEREALEARQKIRDRVRDEQH